MHHYAHHLGDYRAHTAHLTMLEDGAYRRLLDLYYMHEKPLPADVAACQRLAAARSKEERAAIEVVLHEFFTLEADGWHQSRADEEVANYRKKAKAGQNGAESRWGTPKENAAATRSMRLSAARAKARHTPEEWQIMLDVIGKGCVSCGIPASELIGGSICKDHVVPIYAGGDDGIWNLQPMCRECNTSKGKNAGDMRANVCPDWEKRLTERLAECHATVNRKPITNNQLREEGAHAPRANEGADDGRRGTRLPEGWQPAQAERDFAADLNLDPEATASTFRDYWAAIPGAKGRKTDWPATWRNWCRRDADNRRTPARGGSGLRPSAIRDESSAFARAADILAGR